MNSGVLRTYLTAAVLAALIVGGLAPVFQSQQTSPGSQGGLETGQGGVGGGAAAVNAAGGAGEDGGASSMDRGGTEGGDDEGRAVRGGGSREEAYEGLIGSTVDLPENSYQLVDVPVPSSIDVLSMTLHLRNTNRSAGHIGALSAVGASTVRGYAAVGGELFRYSNASGRLKWNSWGSPPAGGARLNGIGYAGDGSATSRAFVSTQDGVFLADNGTAEPVYLSWGERPGAHGVTGVSGVGTLGDMALAATTTTLYRIDNSSGTPSWESWGATPDGSAITSVTRCGDLDNASFVGTDGGLYRVGNLSTDGSNQAVWTSWGEPPDGKDISAVSGHLTTRDRVVVATTDHVYSVDNRSGGQPAWRSHKAPPDGSVRDLAAATAVGDVEGWEFSATDDLLYRVVNVSGAFDWDCWGAQWGIMPSRVTLGLGNVTTLWEDPSFIGLHPVGSTNTTPEMVSAVNTYLDEHPTGISTDLIPLNFTCTEPVRIKIAYLNITYNTGPEAPRFASHAGYDKWEEARDLPPMEEAVLDWEASTDPEGDDIESYHVYVSTFPREKSKDVPPDVLNKTITRSGSDPPATGVTVPVEAGNTYHWAVRASDGSTWGPWSLEWYFSVNCPPSRPEAKVDLGYRLSLDPGLMLRLEWTKSEDMDDEGLNYMVEWSEAGGDTWRSLYWGEKNGAVMDPAALKMRTGVGYQWRVAGNDSHVTGPWSDADEFAFNGEPKRPFSSSPTLDTATVTVDRGGTFKLYWTDCTSTDYPEDDVVDYTVRFGYGTGEPTWLVETANLTRTWAETPAVDVEGAYSWRVTASDGYAETMSSLFLINVRFPTGDEDLNLTTELLSPKDGKEVAERFPALHWTGSGSESLSYDVYLGDDRDKVASLSEDVRVEDFTDELSYTAETALREGGTYHWTVIPRHGKTAGTCASGVWSFTVDLSSPAPGAKLVSPRNGAVVTVPQAELEWRPAGGDGNGVRYDVYLDTAEEPGTLLEPDVAGTSVTATGLEEDTTYRWRVVPFTEEAMGSGSEVWSFTYDPDFVPSYGFNLSADTAELAIAPEGTGDLNLTVTNSGNTVDGFCLSVENPDYRLLYDLYLAGDIFELGEEWELQSGESAPVLVRVKAPETDADFVSLLNFTAFSVSDAGGAPSFLVVDVKVEEDPGGGVNDGEDGTGGDGVDGTQDGGDGGGGFWSGEGAGGPSLYILIILLTILVAIVGVMAVHTKFQADRVRMLRELEEEDWDDEEGEGLEGEEEEEGDLIKRIREGEHREPAGSPGDGGAGIPKPAAAPVIAVPVEQPAARPKATPVAVPGDGLLVKALPAGTPPPSAKPVEGAVQPSVSGRSGGARGGAGTGKRPVPKGGKAASPGGKRPVPQGQKPEGPGGGKRPVPKIKKGTGPSGGKGPSSQGGAGAKPTGGAGPKPTGGARPKPIGGPKKPVPGGPAGQRAGPGKPPAPSPRKPGGK